MYTHQSGRNRDGYAHHPHKLQRPSSYLPTKCTTLCLSICQTRRRGTSGGIGGQRILFIVGKRINVVVRNSFDVGINNALSFPSVAQNNYNCSMQLLQYEWSQGKKENGTMASKQKCIEMGDGGDGVQVLIFHSLHPTTFHRVLANTTQTQQNQNVDHIFLETRHARSNKCICCKRRLHC